MDRTLGGDRDKYRTRPKRIFLWFSKKGREQERRVLDREVQLAGKQTARVHAKKRTGWRSERGEIENKTGQTYIGVAAC